MKIENVTPVTSWIVETDDTEWPTWRVSNGGQWENLMGMSWEAVEPPEGLEEKFKKWYFRLYREHFE